MFVTILLGIFLGIFLYKWTIYYIIDNNYDFLNKTLVIIILLALLILPPIILILLVLNYIVLPCVKKADRLQKEACELFLKSIETMREDKFVKKYSHIKISPFPDFIDERYRVEFIRNANDICGYWYHRMKNDCVNSRFVDFDHEPTVDDALRHGPWYKTTIKTNKIKNNNKTL